jgi:glycosyltransferase involved in cell wall biosynthesis
MMFTLAIIIPVYNHGRQLLKFMPKIKSETFAPIILIDDCSDATTREILEEMESGDDGITLVRQVRNMGKGAAVATGMRTAMEMGFTHAMQIDADGQHDSRDMAKMLNLAKNSPSALVAGRPVYDDSIPWWRFYSRYLTHVCVWIQTLSFDIEDSMCGFRIYPLRAVLPLLDTPGLGKRMDFDPEIVVRSHWAGIPIVTMPTLVKYAEDGQSHFLPFKDNALITWMHIRLFFGAAVRLPVLVARHFRRTEYGH